MSNQLQKSMLRSNSDRRREFQTHTEIIDAGGKKVIRKFASNPQAAEFLKLISEREQKSASFLKVQFEVLCGSLNENYIEYEFLPFTPLKEAIRQKMSEGDIQEAGNLFDEYLSKVTSLEKLTINPEEFLKTLVNEKNGSGQSFECLKMGLVDLMPRNILVNGDRWIVIDNEWSFDFPVPVEFILFRSVREMAITLQDEIRKAASEEKPVTYFFRFGLTRFFVPEYWLESLRDYNVNFPQNFEWEFGFQRYVSGNKCKSAGRITKNSMAQIHILPLKPVRNSKLRAGLKLFQKILPTGK